MEIDELGHKVQARLIAISSAILFIYHSKVKIQEVSLISTKLIITNENAIVDFLWIFWLYLYIRAIQYLQEFGAKEFSKSFDAILSDNFNPIVWGVNKTEYKHLPMGDSIKANKVSARIVIFPKSYLFSPMFVKSQDFDKIIDKEKKLSKNVILLVKKRGNINLFRNNVVRVGFRLRDLFGVNFTFGVQLSLASIADDSLHGRRIQYFYIGPIGIVIFFKCFWQSIFFRKSFFESYAPLLFGMMPIVYVWLGRNWMFHLS